eukprot:6736843-Pyramimonas_sp.AAC.1
MIVGCTLSFRTGEYTLLIASASQHIRAIRTHSIASLISSLFSAVAPLISLCCTSNWVVRPFGHLQPCSATLTVQRPAVSILSSGKIAYPMHRPVGAVWEKRGAGRICVLGSGLMFEDDWYVGSSDPESTDRRIVGDVGSANPEIPRHSS